MKKSFPPNWPLIIILVIPIWAIVVFIIWAITSPALFSLRNGTTFPSSWTWTTILLTDIGVVGCGFIIVWGIISGFLTEITETHIRRHLFLWHEEINFPEISQAIIKNYRLVLRDEKQQFTINLMFYKSPEEVLSFITKHIRIK